MVSTYVDAPSGIVTVKIRAFRKADALAIGDALVTASETLVNRISDHARRDATAMAEKDIRQAFAAVQAALTELHTFRDKAGFLDPGQATSDISKLLIPLMTEKIKLESDLFVAGREWTRMRQQFVCSRSNLIPSSSISRHSRLNLRAPKIADRPLRRRWRNRGAGNPAYVCGTALSWRRRIWIARKCAPMADRLSERFCQHSLPQKFRYPQDRVPYFDLCGARRDLVDRHDDHCIGGRSPALNHMRFCEIPLVPSPSA